MRNIAYILATLIVGGCFVGCSDTMNESTGIGRLMLKAEISPEIKVSRAMEQEEIDALSENCLIWIAKSGKRGLVRQYKGIDNLPAEGIWLTTDSYFAEAWAGDSVPASFDKRYFRGHKDFDITSGNVDNVKLVCGIANVGVSLSYDQSVDEVLSDLSMTVSNVAGSLTWNGKDDNRGYFMMSSRDKENNNTLKFVLTGKDEYGTDYSQEGVIENVQPGVEYLLYINHEGVNSTSGGLYFNIEIEEAVMDINHYIEIESAPIITNRLANGFDEPVFAEQGDVEYLSFGVKSTAPLTEVLLDLEGMGHLLAPYDIAQKFDIFAMHEQNEKHQILSDLGIDHDTHEDADYGDDLIIFLRSKFLNRLGNGEYPITITATDENKKFNSATLTLIISDAVVKIEPMSEDLAEVWSTTATLKGTVLKDCDNAGFNYRKVGDENWTYVEGTPVVSRAAWTKGTKYEVKLTGLEPNTQYEYSAVSGTFVSNEKPIFATEPQAQLPNASFEDWCMDGNTQRIAADANNLFWDSGNKGSATVGTNITTPSTDFVHDGQYSACLKSTSIAGVLAAGNVFVGKFIARDGTNGILGWGRPWGSRPSKMTAWVKYMPVGLSKGDSNLGVNKGDPDVGKIYIALLDDSKQSSNGETWPCIIKTKAANRQLFDPQDSKVIAYGEILLEGATAGDALVPIEIPIEYRRTDIKPSNIVVVAAASRYGDYFIGGVGSVMYLDDIELVY